ncbi:MAG: class I SAM-dependent methyltransferase [Phenylobacterium sp.]|uniref:class I SAM-dependent methyltransferase n=1 Tax=Phenylobacterium sp. TaxID=1871053 RepID=UPI00271EB73E|nr:class I SAM-dependent methyltransferase [Phenylobacterium sp.]MDO8900244.1 class I SAM-dependent methyltransferase [Phenylobacterium sp.]
MPRAAPAARDARFWDRTARKYAKDPIADMAGYERTLERTRHYLKPGDSVLEFGCGTGTAALQLAPAVARYEASDLSGEMIAIAQEKAAAEGLSQLSFAVAAPEDGPWPDGSFDVALGFNVLHLIADRDAAFAALHRVLKPGGLLITKTPCLAEMSLPLRLALPLALPVMQLIGKAPSVAFLSADKLEGELAAAGFEILERASHGSSAKDARPFLVARRP